MRLFFSIDVCASSPLIPQSNGVRGGEIGRDLHRVLLLCVSILVCPSCRAPRLGKEMGFPAISGPLECSIFRSDVPVDLDYISDSEIRDFAFSQFDLLTST